MNRILSIDEQLEQNHEWWYQPIINCITTWALTGTALSIAGVLMLYWIYFIYIIGKF